MNNSTVETPFWARWENPGIFQRVIGGIGGLFGLNRGGRNFPVFPDDTFLVSYPRSGNTWTRFLIANLISQGELVTFANIEKKIPDPTAVNRKTLARIPRPRIIKSHECFDPRYKKVIYIVRDPRDVLVSYYYFQLKKRFIEDGYPMDRYTSRFVAGDTDNAYGSWGENVAGWLATRGSSSKFLLLRYEDMIEHPSRELSKVASFLGIEPTLERLARAVEMSSVDRMRQLEKAEANLWITTKKTRQDIPFVRSAAKDGWRSTLPENFVAQIESAWGPLMKMLKYELVTQPNSNELIITQCKPANS
jgi:hypothetical protein